VPLSFLRRFLERKPRTPKAPSLLGTSYVLVPKEILSPKASSARYLCNFFSATSYATIVAGDQHKRYNVSVTFGGLNDEELQKVAAIGLRRHDFRNLTVNEVMTLAAITRMEEFRREDRFL
jgi:hypothetical protein